MACVPGSPCNPLIVNTIYPKRCNNGLYTTCPSVTNLIYYNGPNLPNSGVNTNDDLNVVIQKLDNEFDPLTLAQTLLHTIQNDTSLLSTFCQIVTSCSLTTTTTTTVAP
jgi:hypothetical protein